MDIFFSGNKQHFHIEICVKDINRHYSVILNEVVEWILIVDVVDTK